MKIALYQARTGIDPVANAKALVRAVGDAHAAGAAMLFTPEMSGLLDRDGERASSSLAVEGQDHVLASVRQAAAAGGIWVQLGSLAIRRTDGKLANRAFMIDDRGRIVARYDKMHLFDADLPGGESWRESSRYAPGNEAVAVQTPMGRLGLSICYDLRFPDLYGALNRAGATAFSIPAAFTVPTGRAHWHVLCRARAIEAGAFVAAAAQCGRHEDGRETFGHSLVVDPWGEVLLDMGNTQDAIGMAEVELARVGTARSAIPAAANRRDVGDARIAA